MKRYIKKYIQRVLVLVMMFCSWNPVFAGGEDETGGSSEGAACYGCAVEGMGPDRVALNDAEEARLWPCMRDSKNVLNATQQAAHVPSEERVVTYAIEARAKDKDLVHGRYLSVKSLLARFINRSLIYHAPDFIGVCKDNPEECSGVLVHVCRADGGWTELLISNYSWTQDVEEGDKRAEEGSSKHDPAVQQTAYVDEVQKKIDEKYFSASSPDKQGEEIKEKKQVSVVGAPSKDAPVSKDTGEPSPTVDVKEKVTLKTAIPDGALDAAEKKPQEVESQAAKSAKTTAQGVSGTEEDREEPRDWSFGVAEFSISGGYTVHIPFSSDVLLEDQHTDFKPQQAANVMLHLGISMADDWILLASIGGGYGNRNLDGFFGVGVQPVLLWHDYLFFLPGVNFRAFHPDREEVFLQGRQLTMVVGLGDCFFGGKLCAEVLYEVGDMVESFPLQQGRKEAVSSLCMGFYPRVRYLFYTK